MDIVAIGFAIATLLGAITVKLIASELAAWGPTFTHWLVDRAASRIPDGERERYREEWHAHIDEWPGLFGKLWHAISCFKAAVSIFKIVEHRGVKDTSDKIALFEQEFHLMRSMYDGLLHDWNEFFARVAQLETHAELHAYPKFVELRTMVVTINDQYQSHLETLSGVDPREVAARFDGDVTTVRRLIHLFESQKRSVSDAICAIELATPASRPPNPPAPSRPT